METWGLKTYLDDFSSYLPPRIKSQLPSQRVRTTSSEDKDQVLSVNFDYLEIGKQRSLHHPCYFFLFFFLLMEFPVSLHFGFISSSQATLCDSELCEWISSVGY